jgi:hypothetical protein
MHARGLGVAGLEGRLADQHGVQDDAHAPHVRNRHLCTRVREQRVVRRANMLLLLLLLLLCAGRLMLVLDARRCATRLLPEQQAVPDRG